MLGDRVLLAWQVAAALAGVFCVLVLSPWAMVLTYRLAAVPPPPADKVRRACAIGALVSGVFVPLVIAVFLSYFCGQNALEPMKWYVALPSLLALLGGTMGIALAVLDAMLIPKAVSAWSRLLPCAAVIAIGVTAVDFSVDRSLVRLRVLNLRRDDAASLRAIARALETYYIRDDVYPDDLRKLVDAGLVDKKTLLGALSQDKDRARRATGTPYAGPCEFNYIRPSGEATVDLIWLWQNPKYNDGEGGFVVYKSAAPRWVGMDHLFDEVTQTYERLCRPAAVGTPVPASAPTTLPSTNPVSLPATLPTTKPQTMPASAPATRPSTKPASIPAAPATMSASNPSTSPASIPDISAPVTMPAKFP